MNRRAILRIRLAVKHPAGRGTAPPFAPLVPIDLSSARSDSLQRCEGSFVYPGSTVGFPSTIALQFSTTQPDRLSPTLMSRETNIQEPSMSSDTDNKVFPQRR
jgi:hypothetical protein